MTKIEEINGLIAELVSWQKNRTIASSRRTHGRELNSDPLKNSIKLLVEYRESLV